MPNNETAGKPITAAEAKAYIKGHLDVKKCLRDCVLTRITRGDLKSTSEMFNETVQHFDTDVNAFLFSKEMILRFFDTTKPAEEQASHLLVLLGSKYLNDENKGKPTVVVSGVNRVINKDKVFTTLDIDEPATEQPPALCIPELPPHDAATGNPKIEFSFI